MAVTTSIWSSLFLKSPRRQGGCVSSIRALYEDEWRDDWAAFRHPGPPQVDVVLTRPGTKRDAHHRRAWELLLADEELRAEYERLKAAGMSGAQKAEFFDRVVAMLDDADA